VNITDRYIFSKVLPWRMGESTDPATDVELAAVHELELGLEWLYRAHGNLVAFHHATGHAMDHVARAESLLRDCGHGALADTLRDEHLPRGVIDGDRWSYDVLESFQTGLLRDLTAVEERARTEVADGERHAVERRQEREWKANARED
jgi:hypothetical protein